jgi:hypothetical protein
MRLYRYLAVLGAAIAAILFWRHVVAGLLVIAAIGLLAWAWRVVVSTVAVLRFRERAIVLNWSERHTWKRSPEVSLFREFLGGGGFAREYNPAAIVVPPTGRKVQPVRFWRAFRDFKHGKDRRLRRAEADLQHALDAVSSRPSVATDTYGPD